MIESTDSLRTVDGVRLAAHRWMPSAAPTTMVVLVHGFTGSKDHPEVVAVGEALADAGYGVLTYDARGHHDSDGLCTLGDSESLDVAAAVAAARSSTEHVVTVGASMGGIAVVRHAGTDPGLSGVVTVSAPARWRLPRNVRSVFAAGLTRTDLGRRLAARHLGVRIAPEWTAAASPEEIVPRIVAPLAIVHGAADRMVPATEAARLAGVATGPVRLDIVEGMGHSYHPLSIPAILGAVDWAMGARQELPDAHSA